MKLAGFGLLFFIMYFFVFPTTAYAYLDPAAGSIALQVIVGGLLAVLATIRLYWKRMKSIITRQTQTQNGGKMGTVPNNGQNGDSPQLDSPQLDSRNRGQTPN
ncbi:MAG TPA: hypothetical protein VGK99_17365 [Acidobacteriota bacterium]|jgi:hypothetical protein